MFQFVEAIGILVMDGQHAHHAGDVQGWHMTQPSGCNTPEHRYKGMEGRADLERCDHDVVYLVVQRLSGRVCEFLYDVAFQQYNY